MGDIGSVKYAEREADDVRKASILYRAYRHGCDGLLCLIQRSYLPGNLTLFSYRYALSL